MRKPFKIIALLLIVALLPSAIGVGYAAFRKSQWRRSGGVTVQPGDWLQTRMLIPAVLRELPLPGLTGEPTHFYFCEGGDIEINHLHFRTTFPRDEVTRQLEPFLRGHGFDKTGPNFTRGGEQINIAYETQDGQAWVKVFMTRK